MALKDIIASIEMKLKDELHKIDEEEEKELKRLKNLFDRDEQEIRSDFRRQLDERKAALELKMRTLQKMEERNMLLTTKSELINEVFEKALAELVKLPEKEYRAWLEKLLAKLPHQKGHITAAKGKKAMTKELVAKLKLPYEVEHEGHFHGGFIAKTDKLEVNATFESLLMNQEKMDREIEIAKMLFV